MKLHPHVQDLFEKRRLTLIAGPCVIESKDMCLQLADALKQMTAKHSMSFVFKASFDKANRTSIESYRGPGQQKGLSILKQVQSEIQVPVLTDVHETAQVPEVADAVDVLQIPAFLCRQTDLIAAVAKSGLPANIKKGQFLAPNNMEHVANKFRALGGKWFSVTERGTSFGYHDLVVDMRSLVILREVTNAPVVFDATHSTQQPGAGKGVTLGQREFSPVLARAAAAVGIDGLFCEVHPNPPKALSDGPNSLTLDQLDALLKEVVAIHDTRQKHAQKT